MNVNLEILAIIPARGGSKGIPGKNIKPLNGIPLINYSIKIAKKFAEKLTDKKIIYFDKEHKQFFGDIINKYDNIVVYLVYINKIHLI